MPWIDSEVAVEILRDSLQHLGFYAEAVHNAEKPWIGGKQPDLLTNATKKEIFDLFPDTGSWEEEDWDEYREKFDPVGMIWADYDDTWIHPGLNETNEPNTIRFYFPADQHVDVKINRPLKYNSDKVICFYSKGEYPQFSNFYPAKMEIKTYRGSNPDGSMKVVNVKEYASVEHYFQIMKALEFDPDGEVLKQMGNHLTCKEIKSLGRKVQNFDASVWNTHRRIHMRDAVAMKFYQNEELQGLLLSTGDAILAEASPRDTFWGIGYSGSNPKAHDPAQWRGKNVLGNMLMALREEMKEDKEGDLQND